MKILLRNQVVSMNLALAGLASKLMTKIVVMDQTVFKDRRLIKKKS
jgi:hypothetical protein